MLYIVLTIRINTLHQKSAIIINNINNNYNNSRKKEGKTHRLDRVILFISMERPNTSGRVEHKYSNPLTLQKNQEQNICSTNEKPRQETLKKC
jgi:hypothetical protein